MENTIKLVEIDPSIHTAYIRQGGGTRLPGGAVAPFGALIKVGDSNLRATWRASKATAAGLLACEQELVREGFGGDRLTDAFRQPSTAQAAARANYEAWLAAGEPAPDGPGWVKGMKTAYVAPPGKSGHGWGGSTDTDVKALKCEVKGGATLTGNEAYAVYREISARHGFTFIVGEAKVNQSEAWHRDHFGPLAEVRAKYIEERAHNRQYGDAYGLTQQVGNILAGTFPGHIGWRYVQARLLVGGFWCGLTDGVVGKMTRGALDEALQAHGHAPIRLTANTPISEVINALDEVGVGLAEIAAL